MALTKFVIKGYGQLEINQAPFRRSGRVEAQCKMDAAIPYLENGMLVAVDRGTRTIKMPTGAENEQIGLNYTTEYPMYDERDKSLKGWKLDNNTFLPRIGFVGIGDKWTTNALAYDTDEFANEDAVKEAIAAGTALFGVPCENGYHKITATKGTGFAVQVIKADTMPDGQFAVQFGGMQ